MVIDEKDYKSMRRMAQSKAHRVARIAQTDRDALADDLEQAGWVAWLVSYHKEKDRRWADVAGAMSDYWRRGRWGVHYRNVTDPDDPRVLDRGLRPDMDHVDVTTQFNLASSFNVEESVLGMEILSRLEKKFAESDHKERFESTLLELLVYSASGVRGNICATRKLPGSTRKRYVDKIKTMYKEINQEGAIN